jgi:hypothetical protein
MEESEKLISQFNDAIQKIQRLNDIWVASRQLREKGLLKAWYFKLDGATAELKHDAELLDRKNKNNYYIKELEAVTFKIKKAVARKDRTEMYEHIFEKECLLREIQDEAGMGPKRRPADDDEME